MPTSNGLSSNYIHGADASEQRRLEVQAELLGGAEFLPALQPGMHLLDVGCGTGAIARAVAGVVAPGQVIGVDLAEAQLVTARRLAAQQGLTNLLFCQGDAYHLQWPAATFAGVYERFMLEHVCDPLPVICEMARVVQPGGWVCAYEWEAGCMVTYPDSAAITTVWQEIYRYQQTQGGDPWVGRKLYGLFRQAGLADVQATGRCWTLTGAAHDAERLQGYVTGALAILHQTHAALLTNQAVTPDLLAQAEADYQQLLQNPTTFIMHGFCRAIGRKPA